MRRTPNNHFLTSCVLLALQWMASHVSLRGNPTFNSSRLALTLGAGPSGSETRRKEPKGWILAL